MSWKTGKKIAAALAIGGVAVTGAADAQLQAIKTATSISPAERKQGTDAHPQLMAEFGGAYNGPQAAYVNRVGQNIAVQSGLSRSSSDFTVTLLNSPVNNAFAIAGGYVYVTRQLMALMNDQSQHHIEVDSIAAGFELLHKKRVDGLIVPTQSSLEVIRNQPELHYQFRKANLTFKFPTKRYINIGLSKKSKHLYLKEKIENTVAQMLADGTVQRLYGVHPHLQEPTYLLSEPTKRRPPD